MTIPAIRMTRDRVTAENKRVINNDRTVDVNQLVPIKYRWAWNYYLQGFYR
jgi:ribonucleoside-diphosphate reductase beta chain